MIKRLLYLLLLFTAGFSIAQETKNIGPLKVTLSYLSGENPGFKGYQTLQFKVVNGDQKSHDLKIVLSHIFPMDKHVSQVIKSLTIEARGEAAVKLRTWRSANSPSQVRFSLDGRSVDQTFEISLDRRIHSAYNQKYYLNILTDTQTPPLQTELTQFLNSTAANVLASTANPSDLKQWMSEQIKPVNQWGDHWLDYSPYDLINLSGQQWRTLNASQKKALTTWLQCGGTLLIRENDRTGLPMEWQTASGQEANPNLGIGRLLIKAEGELFKDSDMTLLFDMLIDRNSGIWATPEPATINKVFQVVENLTLPLKSLFLLLIVFSLILGPVNYLYLVRKNRRVWMMGTIPAIAITTTVIVASYIYITEKDTSCVRRETFVHLNELEHRAVIREKVGIYSPVSLRSQQFNSDTLLQPTILSNKRLILDWTHGQTLRGNWISAREPFFYRTTRNETRRERLSIEKQGGNFQVANHLGAPIELLHFTDENGHLYRVENVAVGQTVKALDMGSVAKPEGSGANRFLNHDWRLEHYADDFFCMNKPNLCLAPNRYIAILDGSPFESITHKARTEHHRTLVYGVWEVQQ